MNTEELEYFQSKIEVALISLVLAVCVILSVLVYAITKDFWMAAGTIFGLMVIGFVCYRHFLSVLFVDLKARFLSPAMSEFNRHSSMMLHILDMSVKGKMLPVTRDELMYCILLAEGHKSIFCHLLKLKECSHILFALHESLDRNIASFRGEELTLNEMFAIEQLKNLKDQLPSIE